jgi:diamine N-acetyltransferase
MTLRGEKIYLRALEPEDLSFLLTLENDESVWEISNTTTPYSRFIMQQYLDNAHRDIYEVKQLRLVICETETEEGIGFIDLFDFDPKHLRVGLGIIIFSENHKRKGYAKEAVELTCNYAFTHLCVHQVFANITEDNTASCTLFEKVGFIKSGTRKDWIASGKHYKNEIFYQLLTIN